MEVQQFRSRIQDLVDHGLLPLPAKVEGVHQGKSVTATIDREGMFIWNGETFASPSVAAGHAITKTTGAVTPGRRYFSVNGWEFWSYRAADGQKRTLAELRSSLPADG